MDSLKHRSKSYPRDSVALREEQSPVPMEIGDTPPRTEEKPPVVNVVQEEKDQVVVDTPRIKKVSLIKRTHRKSHKKLSQSCKLAIFYLPAIFLTFFASWYLLSAVKKCGHEPVEFDFEQLEKELEQRTFGQNSSISYFMSNLKTFLRDDFANVMVTWFLGGQGVGKTFTADIVAHAIRSGNVMKFFVPVDYPIRYSTKDIFNMINSKLDPCQISLVVFDDLHYLSSDSKKQLLNFFTLFQHVDFHKKILFVLVSQEGGERIRSMVVKDRVEDPSVISGALVEENEISSLTLFKSLTEYLVVVPFYPIRTKDAEKCVSNDGKHEVFYSESGMFLESGCKGLISKLKT